MIVRKHLRQAALVIISFVLPFACGDPISVPDEITITSPSNGDQWNSWQKGHEIVWNEETATSLIRIELWKNEEKKADVTDWINNTGQYTISNVLPSAWEEGSGYCIKIIDDEGHEGSSGSFSIEDDILISSPTNETRWFSIFADYEITWTETSADIVQIELWKNENKVTDICDWVNNDGSYLHKLLLDQPGGGGYRVKIIDDNGFNGYSEYFGFAQIAAYWPCDGDLQDASGNGHDGVVYNGTAVNDRNGNTNAALRFNPSDDSYGEVSDFYAWNNGITLFAWVEYHQPRPYYYGVIIDKFGEFSFGHALFEFQYNKYQASINNWGQHYDWNDFNYDKWYCLAITYNSTTLQFFIDGVKYYSWDHSGSISDSTHPIIFAHDDDEGEYSNITVDEIIILSEAVDESVIQYLYVQ